MRNCILISLDENVGIDKCDSYNSVGHGKRIIQHCFKHVREKKIKGLAIKCNVLEICVNDNQMFDRF